MTKNTPEAFQKIVENRLQELLRCARICGASEIKLLPGGIEIRGPSKQPHHVPLFLQEC